MKFTEAGEPYYVDHVSKKTQWQHPAATQATQVTHGSTYNLYYDKTEVGGGL